MVKRIGILGITDLTEFLLAGLFRLAPDAHVFLLADSLHRAEDLARQFPCWILDNDRAVIDEADMILVSAAGTARRARHTGLRKQWFMYRQRVKRTWLPSLF